MSFNIIGIDPGKKGGLSNLTVHNGVSETATAMVLPIRGDGAINIPEVLEWADTGDTTRTWVIIEKQSPRPMQGVRRASVMMKEYGRLLGALDSFQVLEVAPKVWQSTMLPNCPAGMTKIRSVNTALELYPSLDLRRTPRCTKLHDGMSDAVLIAKWARGHSSTVIEKLFQKPSP